MNITRINTKKIFEFTDVEIDEPTVQDEMMAVKISGDEQGYDFILALLAQVCTFDGKKHTMEDLRSMKRTDFLQLTQALRGKKSEDSEKTLLSSQDTAKSTTKVSKK